MKAIISSTHTRLITALDLLLVFSILLGALALGSCNISQSSQETQISTQAASPSEVEKLTPTEAATKEDDMLSIETYLPADPEDAGGEGFYEDEYYIWNGQAFSLFFGGEASARRYASFIDTAAEKMGDGITTFALIVPINSEFLLPQRLLSGENSVDTDSQADFMRTAYTSIDSSAVPVNPYNLLSSHCREYIYFASDHHWTGLGAYYAYTAFAGTAGLPALSLDDCEEQTVDSFTGSITRVVNAELNTDSVSYWQLPYAVTDDITTEDGEVLHFDTCYYEAMPSGEDVYSLFLMGDYPLEHIHSESDSVCGKKIAVIHESFGNAFVPYLTYNYEDIYSIDFRYWSGDLSEFCKENGIDDVLIMTNIMFCANRSILDSIENIL